MAYGDSIDRRERAASAVLSGAIVVVVGAALLTLGPSLSPARPVDALDVVQIAPVPPAPVQQEARRAAAPRPEGAAAPANKRAQPSPVIAAPTPLPLTVPAPLVTSDGADSSAGAAALPGPGTGAGGVGSGLGAGRGGDGSGGGGGGGSPRWRSGAIRNSDYPDAASRANAGGTVEVRLAIAVDGRVTACSVMRSSGRSDLDSATCRLVQRRFRFHPARNSAGEAVAGSYGWRQRWWLGAAEGAPP